MNDFEVQLSASLVMSRDSFWDLVYQKFFPTVISSSLHDHDLVAQKHGIDRKLFLYGGKVITIDEKYRLKD